MLLVTINNILLLYFITRNKLTALFGKIRFYCKVYIFCTLAYIVCLIMVVVSSPIGESKFLDHLLGQGNQI